MGWGGMLMAGGRNERRERLNHWDGGGFGGQLGRLGRKDC